MMVGHSFLAFAIAGLVAYLLGIEKDKAIIIAVFSGLFAFVPDVDMIYAFKELLKVFSTDLLSVSDSFWQASTVTHRGLTHSLITGLLATGLFSIYYRYRRFSTGLLTVLTLSAFGGFFGSNLSSIIMAAYAIAGLLVTEGAYRYKEISLRELSAASLIGLLSHPFGDLFTGTPPSLLSPLGLEVFTERIMLHPDPTLNFLGVFSIELAAIWSGLMVAFFLQERSMRSSFYRGSLLGILFSITALFFEPSLSSSYRFVFSILAIGLVSTATAFFLDKDISLNNRGQLKLTLNFFTTLTIGITGYLIVLILLGL